MFFVLYIKYSYVRSTSSTTTRTVEIWIDLQKNISLFYDKLFNFCVVIIIIIIHYIIKREHDIIISSS